MKKQKKNAQKVDNKSLVFQIFTIIFVILIFLVFFNAQYLSLLANGFAKVQRCDLQVYFLDVGQASSTLIVMPDKTTFMIDTGSEKGEKKFVEDVKFVLSKAGCDDIDFLLLTHPDEDHIGGTIALLENFQVDVVFRPKVSSTSKFDQGQDFPIVTTTIYSDVISSLCQKEDCTVLFTENQDFVFGEKDKTASVQIYACHESAYSETNAYCPFVSLSLSDHNFLFTGDATQKREQEFLQDAPNQKFEFLQVAHHGSKYSTSEEFLQSICPKYAFISAGDNLHPSAEVLLRLEKQNVQKIFCTKTDGMIVVGIGEDVVFCSNQIFWDFPLIVTLATILLFVFVKFCQPFSKRPFFVKMIFRK